MDLIRKTKLEELKKALEDRDHHLIILYGPSGSLKTTVLSGLCAQLGLNLEYITDLTTYKNRLIDKNSLGYTDLDNYEFIIKHKSRLENMKNLVIETRSLQSVWKHLKNCKIIEFRKVCDTTVRKLLPKDTKLNEALEAIDGNLHRITFYKYCSNIESVDIYRYLGRLFYSKTLTGTVFNGFRITNYLFNNAINFFEGASLYEVYDGFSLTDFKLEEFYLYSEYLVYKNKKKNVGKYVFKASPQEEFHNCAELCRQFKSTK